MQLMILVRKVIEFKLINCMKLDTISSEKIITKLDSKCKLGKILRLNWWDCYAVR